MSGGAYGQLRLIVNADTRGLAATVGKAATSAGDDASSKISGSMAKGFKALSPIVGSIGKAVGVGLGVASTAAIGFGVAAFKSAARVGEMNATLRALAKANNLSYPAMLNTVTAVRKTGIEANVAQSLVAQFARNNLDLAKSTDLARVAQDAAVISGQNSTDTLDALIHGVTTQNSLVLRNAGINVQAGAAMDAYAKSLGKTSAELNASERAQGVLNAVLEAGKPIAGAYAAAMNEPGKVLRSFPRIVDDIKVAIGTGLVTALGPAIIGAYDLGKAFAAAVEPGGALAPVFAAIGVAVAKLVAPLNDVIAAATQFFATMDPGRINGIVSAIERFGPAGAILGGALAVFSGTKLLGSIPILGPMLQSLLAPLGLIAKALLSVGQAAIALVPGLGAVGPAAGTLGAALGPVGLIVAAVVAALALVMAISPEFRAAVMQIAGAVLSALKPAFMQIIEIAKPLLAVVMEVARGIGTVLAPALVALAPIIGPLGSVLGSLLGIVAGLAKVLALVLIPAIRLYAAFNKLLIVSVIVPVFTAIAAVMRVVASAIALVVRWIFGGSPGLIPAFQALLGVVTSVMGALRGIVVGGFNAIAGAIRAAWAVVTGVTRAAWSAVRSVVSAGISAVRGVVSAGVSAILGVMRRMASGFISSASSAANGFRSAISSGLNGARSIVTSAVSQMISAARQLVSGFASAGAAAASAMAGAIRSGLASVISSVRSAIAGVVNAAKSAAGKGRSVDGLEDAVIAVLAAPVVAAAAMLAGGMVPGAGGALPAGPGVGAHGPGEGGGAVPGIGAGLMARMPDLSAPLAGLAERAVAGLGLGADRERGAVTVNVYPRAQQSETEIAAAVSRRLGWVTATGRA